MTTVIKSDSAKPNGRAGVSVLGLSALGIVFGDIGTSPLYTLKTVLGMTGGAATHDVVLGVLSLIVWTLIMITSVKYVIFAMSIDNDGEGGILALMSLLGIKKHKRPLIVALGLFGAALIYGDGAITPAISVLSALEGLKIVTPDVEPYILPAAVAILVALFAIQPLGTARIGKAFGPIMLLWFVAMAVMGVIGIARHPAVLAALNPLYGLHYLFSSGYASFLILGGVFLCVTGAEALYADMGHFGARPIRLAWSAVVLPSLLLNYAGQTALVLEGTPTTDNIFFRLCPDFLLIPFIVLATVATIIASQSIITGAFSMTRQAIQLGWLPRLRIKQTSEEGYGQIYVGIVNWLLMIVTVGLTLAFRKSDNLASAYGIAVAATMLLTSGLLFIAMREVWGWGIVKSGVVAGAFVCIDASFFLANLTKVADGGYVPLLLASIVFGTMLVWHRGSNAVLQNLDQQAVPVEEFMASLVSRNIPRVPGTAVFLSRTDSDTPPVMVWDVKHNRALHENLFVVNAVSEAIPWIKESERLTISQVQPNYWRAKARFGFMEKPDIPAVLKRACQQIPSLDFDDAVYYVGYVDVIQREDGQGLTAWQGNMFALMERNSMHVSDFFRLPKDSVILIGRQVAI
ncbi:Kup system potassium uptake protein [Collimonas arenae]|uniref:Probable potassium transport system protein Kup n=1 Tax=Collimonas arenae TaxID=279058 RepID=A0A0A1FGZ7_9BURK|nr:KUP/HAK/KT family potassium transporter [Collimonas arenae]AIY42157.1 Kup system potassium uptake protein [Collimonas arenae]